MFCAIENTTMSLFCQSFCSVNLILYNNEHVGHHFEAEVNNVGQSGYVKFSQL
jgi:hypothetical protein